VIVSLYNQISYINSPYPQTHPGRLFVMAKLAGLHPPAVETCRVLEIGASEGENMLGMAMVLPAAQFVGIDLAQVPVERGRKTIADLGLANVRLRQMNLLDLDKDFGEFDYIIAHGLYAWTPMIVRDKILAVVKSNLSNQGVAFVSYNTLPAGHIRKMVREMMLYHIGEEADPMRRLEKARELLQVIAVGRPKPDALEAAVAARAVELLEYTDSALFHDDLADVYEPVHFHEFIAHAARHDLQYVGEANLADSQTRNLAPEAVGKIRKMAAGDRLREAQYLDFARTRRFRDTLLGHAGNELSEGTAEGCYAATSARETEEGVFISAAGTKMTTSHPEWIAYMRRLMSLWPRSEPVSARGAEIALELFRSDMIELHGFAGVAKKAGERPCVSPFARYQAARGDSKVTTLWHRSMEVQDDAGKKLVGLLDGSRDRAELAGAMGSSGEVLGVALRVLESHGMFTE
jgi:2-polyprenyl-3-methyl-5-hydroxy-6-metoxy-1,4-benzoquinol methylase